MRYSGIGGQAVMEGVMMKNQEKYAVAVRKPDHEIEVKVSEYTGIIRNKKIRNIKGNFIKGKVVHGLLSLFICSQNEHRVYIFYTRKSDTLFP